jgi:DNA-binding protein H-NS
MARQTTMKFAAMSVSNLIELRSLVDQHLVQRRKDLEQQLSTISGYISKANNAAGKPNPAKGTKVKPKYRGPKGETWAGRGMRPVWLAALIKQGHKLEEYGIGAKQAAARKKAATKRSAKKKRKAKR